MQVFSGKIICSSRPLVDSLTRFQDEAVSCASLPRLVTFLLTGHFATDAFETVRGVVPFGVVPSRSRRRLLLALRLGAAGKPHQSGQRERYSTYAVW